MKGLLLKDLLVLRRYIKSIGGMMALYLIFALMGGNISFFAGFILLMGAMIPVTSFSYDEYAKWNRFGASLPVTREEMVAAKYLLGLVMLAAGGLTAAAASLGLSLFGTADPVESLLTVAGLFAVAVIAMSVLLPLVYRFGVEHSRMMMAALFALPVAAIFALSKMGVKIPEQTLQTAMLAIPLIAVVGLVFSFWLSCRIFKNQQI